ncbi:hypothetical protein HK101_011957 [Irineochytrium annulatum]|nr:hypothetical protein HK101_011957 [Irineochytrium annulatum]
MPHARDVTDAATAAGATWTLITTTPDQESAGDFSYALRQLNTLDYRYIFLSYQPDLIKPFYLAAYNDSLVDPEHVWISYNPPFNAPTDFNDTTFEPFVGFQFIGMAETVNNTAWEALNQTYYEMNAVDPATYPIDENYPGEMVLAYDCLKVMAKGLEEALAGQPSADPLQLTSGVLGNQLNFTAFQNTGYVTVDWGSFQLNQYGDVAAPRLFMSLNLSNYQRFNFLGYEDAFGETSADATEWFQFPGPQIFYGGQVFQLTSFNAILGTGTLTPPPDRGILTELGIFPNTPLGDVVWLFLAVGMLTVALTLLKLLHMFVTVPSSARWRRQLPLMLLTVTGSFLSLLSLVWAIGRVTLDSCRLRVGLCALGVSLVLGYDGAGSNPGDG